jgi:hypothetical protein
MRDARAACRLLLRVPEARMFRYSAFVFLLLVSASPAAAQNDSRVALHAGAVYARVRDVDVEKVQTLAGQELFALTDARDATADIALFLSQRLWADPSRNVRVYGTLGTGLFNEPGSVLHFGGSVGVSRTLVTAGLATTLVERGVGPVSDQVFPGNGERQLYGEVARTREWGFFVAVSVGLIQ